MGDTETIVIDSDPDDDILFICESSPKKEADSNTIPHQNWRSWKGTQENRQQASGINQHGQPRAPANSGYRPPTQSPQQYVPYHRNTTNHDERLSKSPPGPVFVSNLDRNNPLHMILKKAAKPPETIKPPVKRIATVLPVCKTPQPLAQPVLRPDSNKDIKKSMKLERPTTFGVNDFKDVEEKEWEMRIFHKRSCVMVQRLSEKEILPCKQKLQKASAADEPSIVKKRAVLTTVQGPLKKKVALQKKNLPQSSHHSKVNKDRESPGTSRESDTQQELEFKKNLNESNRDYVKRLVKELLKVCSNANFGKEMSSISRKFGKSLENASAETIEDPSLAECLERSISDIDSIINQKNYDLQEKIRVADKIKHCISRINHGSSKTVRKVSKLYSALHRLNRAIKKVEEREVTSDEEYENPYVTLDKYRAKASKIYKKICFLEGKSSIANRDVYQQFIYTGNVSAPRPVIKALEKYFHKTKMFPNWHDTFKLFQKVVREQKLKYSDSQIYTECKELFQDFGKQLQKRRQRDDFINIIGYLDDDQKNYVHDPADNDSDLERKLEKNKEAFKKKEANILDEFAFRSEREEDEIEEMEEERDFVCSDEDQKTDLKALLSTSDTDSD